MGAEGSIELFQENELENDLGFTKDESMKEIFNRNFEDMVNVLVHPIRMKYNFDWLKARHNGCDDYQVNEFKYACADGTKLHCVKWVRDPDAPLCIVYLHTNTRCLSDATELLPLCNLLNANLLAFDQRGAGQSEGQLSFRIVEDLTAMLESLAGGNQAVRVILWARGMASSIGVQYVTQQQEVAVKWERTAASRRMVTRERRMRRKREEKQQDGTEEEDEDEDEDEGPPQYVKFLVLDSPYTSLKEVVLEAAQHIDMIGASIPPLFVKFALYMFKNKIQDSLDVDPYTVSPLQWLQDSRPVALGKAASLPPCYVLAADSDVHIPSSMGAKLAEEWRKKAGKDSCWYREFPGAHFEEREECLVMTPIQAILDYVNIHEMNREENDDEESKDSTWQNSSGNIENNDDDHDSTTNNQTQRSLSRTNERTQSQSQRSRSKSKSSSQRSHWDEPPRWQDADGVDHCNFCAAPFSMMFRKHHCRRCGLVVCGTCSSSRVPLPTASCVSLTNKSGNADGGEVALVRVCDTCVNLLHLTFG